MLCAFSLLNKAVNIHFGIQIIRSNDFFGQYGKISKLVINKRPALPSSTSSATLPPSVGIYVTYQRKEEALKCIQAVDGSMVGGRILRCVFLKAVKSVDSYHVTNKICTVELRLELPNTVPIIFEIFHVQILPVCTYMSPEMMLIVFQRKSWLQGMS